MTHQTNKLYSADKASYKFSKAPAESPYLVSAAAFAFGLAVTVVILTVRLLSSLLVSNKIEDDLI